MNEHKTEAAAEQPDAAQQERAQQSSAALETPPGLEGGTADPGERLIEAVSEAGAEDACESVAAAAALDPIEPTGADLSRVERIIEALLLAADGALPLEQMQKLVGSEFQLGKRELREVLARLGRRYAGSACELQEVASGWRLQVRPEYGEWVARLWQEKPPKYSRALLETLALIVYRQPITRGEIEDVRGVAVSTNILRSLQERGWVREVGVKEAPGRPSLYGTTHQFLDDFNLKSLDQLPDLPEIKDLEKLEAAMDRLGEVIARGAVRLEQEPPDPEGPVSAAESPAEEPPPDAIVH
jgi:segregation and condensation protein B